VPGSYEQYCPIARSLDLLGDRWTLLVVRELSIGPQRFTDLRAHLPGIPPNVLSQRLKRLTDDGLVTTAELPPPAARTVYELTPRGREAQPILRALIRFGLPELDLATPERSLRRATAATAMFLPWFDQAEASRLDVDEHYDVVVDATTHHLSSRAPKTIPEVHTPAAITLEGPAWAFTRLRQDKTLTDLTKAKTLTFTGPADARTRFRKLYALA
jgi:DNA-binding HxlR family transcriptional regulator